MKVRRATPEDAKAIERIRIRGRQVAYRHLFPPEELDRLPIEWSRWIASLTTPQPGFAAFVAEGGDGMLGWTTVGPSAFPEQYGELHGLYVDPDKWARGAGRLLLARAEEELAFTWTDAILWTLEGNPRTRRFYEAAGASTAGPGRSTGSASARRSCATPSGSGARRRARS